RRREVTAGFFPFRFLAFGILHFSSSIFYLLSSILSLASSPATRPGRLPRGRGLRGRFTGALSPGGASGHESIAAAGSGHAQLKGDELLVNALTERLVLDVRGQLDLPPLAVLAETPLGSGHDPPHWLGESSLIARRLRNACTSNFVVAIGAPN